MQISIPSVPISLYNSIYLHSSNLGELWEPTKIFRGCLYMQRFIYTRRHTHTHDWRTFLERSVLGEARQRTGNTQSSSQMGPQSTDKTHLWASSFCFSNSMIFRSCSFCFSRSASIDFCFWSCCLLCISLSSYKQSRNRHIMHEVASISTVYQHAAIHSGAAWAHFRFETR